MNRKGSTTSFELDATTARLLERIAKAWGVSKDEAVRRAVEQAHDRANAQSNEDWLALFKLLQRSLSLTPDKADEWQDAIREARR